LEDCFRNFSRLTMRSPARGAALGWVSQSPNAIVEMHGGKIWVESKVGEGSTFAFTVPVRATQHGMSKRILVVEDQEDNRQIIRDMQKFVSTCQTRKASCGTNSVALYPAEQPMPKRLINSGYAAIIIGLKVFLAAIVIAIGVVFIWYGATGDPVALGLVPIYIIIVVWSVIYYFIIRRD
jgi:hypothetical protein